MIRGKRMKRTMKNNQPHLAASSGQRIIRSKRMKRTGGE
jgi:hypothetical protein